MKASPSARSLVTSAADTGAWPAGTPKSPDEVTGRRADDRLARVRNRYCLWRRNGLPEKCFK